VALIVHFKYAAFAVQRFTLAQMMRVPIEPVCEKFCHIKTMP